MTPPSTPPSAEQIAEALAGLRVSGHTAFETIRHQKRADILEAALSDAVKRTTEAAERETLAYKDAAHQKFLRAQANDRAEKAEAARASSETARRELEKELAAAVEIFAAVNDVPLPSGIAAVVVEFQIRAGLAARRALSSPSTSGKNTWEDGHAHEWVVSSGDWDGPEGHSDVECSKCGVPGQRNDKTGEVFWPAT